MMNTKYSADMMAADVIRKYRYLDETRTTALQEGDAKTYNRAKAQQDILADLLDKWDISIQDAGINYTRLYPDMQ